jgi:hypothetical protein
MTDEQNINDVTESVPPASVSDNQVVSDQSHNWRQARSELKEKDLTIRQQEMLIRQMEDRLRSSAPPKEVEESVADDDLVTGRHARQLEERIRKSVLKEVGQVVEKREKQKAMQNLRNDEGSWDVIERYADQLEKHYPNLARRLHEDPEAPLLAYEAIKNSAFYVNDQRAAPPKAKASEKAASPPSGMSAGSAMSQARSWQNEAIGDDMWRKFVKETGYGS